MNNFKPELDSETIQILSDIQAIFDQLQIPIFIIGARARVLIFDQQHNTQGRATKDWDIAVKLDTWENYNTLVTLMTEGSTARFKKTNIIHKFIHINTGLEVDVIPFGGISNEQQEITWPWPDSNQMSVLGLEEAFLNTPMETIGNFIVRMPDIPTFIGLKLLAWNNRKANKDLEDILFVLQKYQDDNRLYQELLEEILSENFEFDELHSILIGRDIRKRFTQKKAINKIEEIILHILDYQNEYLPGFVAKNLDDAAWDIAFNKIVKRFQLLQYGLSDSPFVSK